MVGHVHGPDLSGLARKPDVLEGVVFWSGLDDDRGAVLSHTQMIETTGVQKALDDFGVAFLGAVLGHQAAAAAEAGCRRWFLTRSVRQVQRNGWASSSFQCWM
jgi:hypothetical protein